MLRLSSAFYLLVALAMFVPISYTIPLSVAQFEVTTNKCTRPYPNRAQRPLFLCWDDDTHTYNVLISVGWSAGMHPGRMEKGTSWKGEGEGKQGFCATGPHKVDAARSISALLGNQGASKG